MEQLIYSINAIVWSPALIILLLGTGLYFSIRTRFVQLRRVGLMARLLLGGGRKNNSSTSLSSFQAFCLALSGKVGIGNIVGVATAIAFGGPGSVFWMWIVAFLGASTAFTEATLAQKYKFRSADGVCYGGPAAYIEKGMHCPRLAIVFAALTVIGYGLMVLFVQTQGVSSGIKTAFNIDPIITGCIMAFLLGLVLIGGIKRIGQIASAITPFMAIVYILMAIVIVCVNIKSLPAVFMLIVRSAFDINPFVGGIVGAAISMGIRRGLLSNEAGAGGGAIVSGSVNAEMPAQQGLAQAFSVYVDTLLVCSATAFMIITTGSFNIFEEGTNVMLYAGCPELGNNYAAYSQTAIDTVFCGYGGKIVSLVIFLFAFTTVMAVAFYAESSMEYIFHRKPGLGVKTERFLIKIYYAIALALVIIGSTFNADIVWQIADIGVGTLTFLNIVSLLVLFPQALEELRKCEKAYPARKFRHWFSKS